MINILDYKYIVAIDVEATCCDDNSFPDNEREIIQIGMVLFNNKFVKLDSYGSLIRPKLHPILTTFCKRLTNIDQDELDISPYLHDTMRSIEGFLPIKSVIYCSWGNFDRNIITRETESKAIPNPFIGIPFVNAKDYVGNLMGWKKGRGLLRATRSLQLDFEGIQHDAYWDALAVYNILKEVHQRIDNE